VILPGDVPEMADSEAKSHPQEHSTLQATPFWRTITAMKSLLRQTHIHLDLLQVCVSSVAPIFSSAFVQPKRRENTNTHRCVREEVIAFLEAQL
jgi:hypothetical protein